MLCSLLEACVKPALHEKRPDFLFRGGQLSLTRQATLLGERQKLVYKETLFNYFFFFVWFPGVQRLLCIKGNPTVFLRSCGTILDTRQEPLTSSGRNRKLILQERIPIYKNVYLDSISPKENYLPCLTCSSKWAFTSSSLRFSSNRDCRRRKNDVH